MFVVNGAMVGVFHIGEEFFAIDNRCPHAGASLAGGIIEQETVRVDHSHTPEKMQNIGRDTENRVLARAIRSFSERRIFLHGQRTVIL